MKKLFAVLALVGVMTSCKDKKKEDKKPEVITAPTSDEPTHSDSPITEKPLPGVPSFNDADVTAYVKSYEDYIAAYKKAVESKDMSKMVDLAKMGQDLATKGTTAAQKLATSPEDAKKLTDYMTAKSAEIMELSKKLTGQ
jgi:hypothetical protein